MITGTFTVTTWAEVRALAKLGVDPAALGWRCECIASGRGYTTVKHHRGNSSVFGSHLPVVGVRMRKGVVQFDAQFDGGHEWVTADGAWSLRYERKA